LGACEKAQGTLRIADIAVSAASAVSTRRLAVLRF
jgi:hypothetical protein